MFNDFELTFSEECTAFIRKQYPKYPLILEYGAGGSSLLAASAGCTVITTETSAKWLIELMGAYKEQQLSGHIIPIFADIGETKAWGYPVDEQAIKQWPEYPKRAWQYCSEHSLVPDLVLIDGRFRVASFLTTCVNVTKPTTVFFDDFVEREYYHIVKELFEPVKIIGERLAVFKIRPKKISSQFLLNNMHYFLDMR